jgi:hypothetical protein
MNSHVLGASVLLASLAGGVCAQSTFKSYMEDTAQPDFYWPLENSFISEERAGSSFGRIKAGAYELNGVRLNGCPAPGVIRLDYYAQEYFPLFPNHMTRVGGSTALLFGETEGDLDGVTRYLEMDSSHFDDGTTNVEPLVALGMHHKEPWTVHMIVSPDQDMENDRQWETLFDIGNENHANGPVQVLLQVDRDDVNTQTTFRITTEAQNDLYTGYDTRRSYDVVVDHGDVAQVNERLWYQVVVQYYRVGGTGAGRVRLFVNTIKLNSTTGLLELHQEPVQVGNSNEWRDSTSGDELQIGLTRAGTEEFFGSIHHFAVWGNLLDADETVMTGLDTLADAFFDSTLPSNSNADTRTDLAIDWNADPRHFIWDRPTSTSASDPADRKIDQWHDPIWDHAFTYPVVRFMTHDSTGTSVNVTPPGYSPQTNTGPEAIAQNTANWLEYISTNLKTYSSTGKDMMADPDSVSLFWQNWGARKKDTDQSFCFYSDYGESYSLTKNWRDAPSLWRDASSHPVLPGFGSYEPEAVETSAPFYREGMSINAFHSTDIFIHLNNLIETSTTIPTPDRLHWDLERVSNMNLAWGIESGSYKEGWWDHSVSGLEPRSDLVAAWAPPTVSVGSGDTETLSDLATVTRVSTVGPNSSLNNELVRTFGKFTADQYDQALGLGLVYPAIQELNPGIRVSEYKMTHRGNVANKIYLSSKVLTAASNVSPEWLDFSSPVLYPVFGSRITYHNQNTQDGDSETLFQEWETVLGINTVSPDNFPLDNLVTTSMPHNGKNVSGSTGATESEVKADARVLYVEVSKFNLNAVYLAGGGADGAPTSPWLPYPNYTEGDFRIDENRFEATTNDIQVELNQEDIARIAVFAYRHGVREFLWWGDINDLNTQDKHQDVLEGLEYIFAAIDNLRATIPTGQTSSPDFTGEVAGVLNGVPDGIVDYRDFQYFANAYGAGNLEADIAGGGVDGDRPDGAVDEADTDYFSILYTAATAP